MDAQIVSTLAPADRPFVIGVCGGSASGKSTVCEYIKGHLPGENVAILSSDAFYKELTPEQSARAYTNEFDFDSPQAIDFEALTGAVRDLRSFKDVQLPVYDFASHARKAETVLFPRRHVVIVEGILIFTQPELRDLFDLKVFVECDGDLRLARRLRRDIAGRGRDVVGVLDQYFRFVKPSYDVFVEPSKRHADVILPNTGTSINLVSIDVLVKHIQTQFALRRP
jgi:uridine kinase